jgi:hypothetical protein
MKKLLLLFCLLVFVQSGFAQAYACIYQGDAEKILGGASKLSSVSTERKTDHTRYACTWEYKGREGLKAGDTSHLYYLVEAYTNEAQAAKVHHAMVVSNQRLPGFVMLPGIGDEGCIHADGANFQTLMLRKDNKILRIKINKTTPRTSTNALKQVGGKIAATL